MKPKYSDFLNVIIKLLGTLHEGETLKIEIVEAGQMFGQFPIYAPTIEYVTVTTDGEPYVGIVHNNMCGHLSHDFADNCEIRTDEVIGSIYDPEAKKYFDVCLTISEANGPNFIQRILGLNS